MNKEDLSFIDSKTIERIKGVLLDTFKFYSDEYKIALKRATAKEKGPKGGRRLYCELCNIILVGNYHVDHIDPRIPLDKTVFDLTFRELYFRTWVKSDQINVLCKSCHTSKTKKENKTRRQIKKEIK